MENKTEILDVARVYTIHDAVRKTGLKKRSVQLWAEKLGLKKWAGRYALSDRDIERIRQSAQDRPGRPKITD